MYSLWSFQGGDAGVLVGASARLCSFGVERLWSAVLTMCSENVCIRSEIRLVLQCGQYLVFGRGVVSHLFMGV